MAKSKQRNIPDAEHTARYCPFTTLLRNGRPSGTAFCLRPKEEYLSISWLEAISTNGLHDQLKGLRKIWKKKPLKGRGSKIARLNVGKSKNLVQNETKKTRSVDFVNFGKVSEPSYSAIHGATELENEIGRASCRERV